jgi:threonylcarbamoyladenosine tRNA methylthiotransferase MtaB
MTFTFALETLGCKVNQYESSHIIETLEKAGHRRVAFRDVAEVYVVHSCAVTSKAGFQTRQLLRRAARLQPSARVAVIGCDAQVDSERLAGEGLATHVLGAEEKYDLLRWLDAPGSFDAPVVAAGDPRGLRTFRLLPVEGLLTDRARAFLKVQDGCDAFCSYCIVPHARGRSRSLPAGEVRAEMDRLLAVGRREVVLTGVHLGQWGRDLEPPGDLAGLLLSLREGALPPRIRLSSLEPVEWTPGVLDVLEAMPEICPHFHVPLQSGDDEILGRMGRPYNAALYRDLLFTLRRLYPRAALGADVLVGFPGETEAHFRNTYELMRELPLNYFHVFPYSPRPGTPAADWPGRLAGGEMKRRAGALRDLGARKRRAFHEGLIGEWVEVLVETEPEPGVWKGTSENYLSVRFRAARPLAPGALARVRLLQADREGLWGELDA